MLLLYSILITVGLGLFFAFILFIADKKLRVEEDPRVEKIEKALAGLNCGACGYPSCRLAAEAMVKGEADIGACLVGGENAATEIAGIVGKEFKKKTHKNIAVVHCGIDSTTRQITAGYNGVKTCIAANLTMQGGMACRYGCLGFGDCAKVCPVDAITMKNNAPMIDIEKCIGCGKCVKVCPRHIISLRLHVPGERLVDVACSNIEPGKQVRAVCKIGCIACGICQKLSEGVFEVNDNLSRINFQKAKEKTPDWDIIIQKCPTHCILEIKTK
ncbi:MAG: RnfABCDGE type electron transport complex subunit B [Candidatus Ratteibacteria bacterium]|nr:RnfABCDGE type electron transport complex subunit B [Candidatus Ratteibacteria bacterium]